MYYDEEAIYQDADVLQAQYEAESRRAAALRAQGVCVHGGCVGVGADGVAHYPEAEGLIGTQVRCTDGCGQVFASRDEWHAAHRSAGS